MERTEGSGFFVLVMGSNKPTKRRKQGEKEEEKPERGSRVRL